MNFVDWVFLGIETSLSFIFEIDFYEYFYNMEIYFVFDNKIMCGHISQN